MYVVSSRVDYDGLTGPDTLVKLLPPHFPKSARCALGSLRWHAALCAMARGSAGRVEWLMRASAGAWHAAEECRRSESVPLAQFAAALSLWSVLSASQRAGSWLASLALERLDFKSSAFTHSACVCARLRRRAPFDLWACESFSASWGRSQLGTCARI